MGNKSEDAKNENVANISRAFLRQWSIMRLGLSLSACVPLRALFLRSVITNGHKLAQNKTHTHCAADIRQAIYICPNLHCRRKKTDSNAGADSHFGSRKLIHPVGKNVQ
jgi:hypothetical protein